MVTIDLNVNAFDSDKTEWTETGVSPWIDASGDGNEIYSESWDADKDEQGLFSFEDMPRGIPTACWLHGRVKATALHATIWIRRSDWSHIGVWDGTINTVWKNVKMNIWSEFYTRALINNAKVGFRNPTITGVYIDHAFLRVTYTRAILKVAGSHRVGLKHVAR